MITEEEKYKAETLKIIGIAMLTPVGPVFLTPSLLLKQLGILGLIAYICISFASFIVGVMLLEAGRRFVDKKGRIRKWDQTA